VGEATGTDRLGAVPSAEGGFTFRVWGPRARRVTVSYLDRGARRVPLEKEATGYFVGADPAARAGDRYWLSVDRHRLPDPTSRSQPDGVGGPSALVDLRAARERLAPRRFLQLANEVIYELHVGTFSTEGTFDAAAARLAPLADLGVTVVELLPVEEERGERGWGYGPVHQFAVRRAYGGPEGLVRFVAAAHELGLGILLDVVYNHWSGQAAFLERFGPYFHPRATTPWGPTPNVDGPMSGDVRRYFFDNARMWLDEYGVDGFRLDAVHEVFDRSSRPFWGEFSEHCRAVGDAAGRRPVLIAESGLNDVRVVRPVAEGGWGLDAQWSDDFHHALHAALTGERAGYYVDFGSLEALARAFERPFLLDGVYSRYHERRHGAPVLGVRPDQFVVFDQNHDQVGNRGDGARLTSLLPEELVRVALGLTLLAPYVPMLFMGEEYGETRPFYFFADPPRVYAGRLRAGRIRDLKAHGFPRPPPDPMLLSTFARSRLDPRRAASAEGEQFRALVAALLRLRREVPALHTGSSTHAQAWEEERLLAVRRASGASTVVLLANLGEVDRPSSRVGWAGDWAERLSTSEAGEPLCEHPRWSLEEGSESRIVPARTLVVLEGVPPGSR